MLISPMNGRRLAGAPRLVTGATGGIGSAISSAFVREGARLAAVGRNHEALIELCTTLGPERAYAVSADVGDPAEAEAAVAGRAHPRRPGHCRERRRRRLRVEAGRGAAGRQLGHDDPDQLSGTFHVCRAALPCSWPPAAVRS